MELKRDGLFSYHALTDKEKKNLLILELIRKKGPISRSDISKITDINIVSISNYMKSYLDKKIIVEKGFDVSSGGRRPELVEFNAAGGYVVGVDVGNVEIAAVMTDMALAISVKRKVLRPKSNGVELHEAVISLVQTLADESKVGISSVKAIGIGAAGGSLVSLRDEIEKTFHVDTFIGGDAACAAFGEKKLNPEANVEDLLYMYSDIGCGIIVRGDIYFGAGGLAGEMQIFNEKIAKDEEKGILKDAQYLRPWCIDLGITQAAKREIEKGVGTKMVSLAAGNIENISKQVVIEAARQNDEIALDIIKSAGINLGIRTAYLVNLFDPEVVVIGGCIEKAGDLILEPIRSAVKKLVLTKQASRVKIIPSSLGEDAVSLGAASLAVREIILKA